MREAISIVYGGLPVLAKESNYGDCNDLKIVCPNKNCREPLFLVIPKDSDPYFSHYADEKGIDLLFKDGAVPDPQIEDAFNANLIKNIAEIFLSVRWRRAIDREVRI